MHENALFQHALPSPVEHAGDLGLALSSAVEAWCLPVHDTCRLPRAVLEGTDGEMKPHLLVKNDYEALCHLVSLVS